MQLVNFGVYGVQCEYQLRLLLGPCSEWSECLVYFQTISVFFYVVEVQFVHRSFMPTAEPLLESIDEFTVYARGHAHNKLGVS